MCVYIYKERETERKGDKEKENNVKFIYSCWWVNKRRPLWNFYTEFSVMGA